MESTNKLLNQILSFFKKGINSALDSFKSIRESDFIGLSSSRSFSKKLGKLTISASDFEDAGKVEILNEINSHSAIFAEIGIEDGRKGLPPQPMCSIAEKYASIWQTCLKSSFEEKKRAEEERLADIKTRISELKILREANTKYKKVIEDYYEWNYKSFSIILGSFYLLISFLLIIADLPLSFQLTAKGFDLPLDRSEIISLTNIESFALAFGIALFTVYIKIFYDEYFTSSIEKQIMQFRRTSIPWVEEGQITSEDNKSKMRTVWYLRLAIKIIILIIILIVIAYLGLLRHHVFTKEAKEEANLLSDYIAIIPLSNEFLTAQRVSFILLTLIFPLVGGVCMSLGLDKVQNWRLRKKTTRKSALLIKKDIKLNNELVKYSKNLEKYNSILEWCADIKFTEEYSTYFRASYIHGFDNGINEADIQSVFNHAERMRNQELMHGKSHAIKLNILNV